MYTFIVFEYTPLRINLNFILYCCGALILVILSTSSFADSRQIIEYSYDASGNLIGILPEDSNNPPSISDTGTQSISHSGNTDLLLTGDGLRNATVTTATNGIIIDILSSTNNTLKLQISLAPNVPIGTYSLAVSTSLGNTALDIEVLPSVAVYPEIITLVANQSQALALNLSAANNRERTINLQLENPLIATVSPTSITLPAGQTHYTGTITISSHALGTTQLILSSTDINIQSIPVYITSPYSLPSGNYQQYSQPLGIELLEAPSPELHLNGPFTAQIKVQNGHIIDPINEHPEIIQAPQLGIVTGAFIDALTPSVLSTGSENMTLAVSGAGLSNVDEVRIYPPGEITIGALTISANGNEISFSVSLSQQQNIGRYQIQLYASGELIQTATAQAISLYIVKDIPQLSYVNPILIARDSLLSIDIAGDNFDFVTSIRIEPQDGITLAPDFSVNSSGTLIKQKISVDLDAPLGERVVIVEAVAGESAQQASENNTLSIINGLGSAYSNILARPIGVLKQHISPPDEQTAHARTPLLGIITGSYFDDLTPILAPVGSTVTLTVTGVSLEHVSTVDFLPADGLITSALNVAADGLSLSFDVNIATSAPVTQRQLLLGAATGEVISAVPIESGLFEIIRVNPVVTSVYPQHIAVSVTAMPITVTGRDLDNTTALRFEPAGGISIDSFSVAQDGRSLNLWVSTTAGAQSGARILIVTTSAGQSSEIPSISNSLEIANKVSTIATLLSMPLGIQKDPTEPTLNELPRLLTTPELGIVRQFTTTPEIDATQLFSAPLGLAVGAVATQILPRSRSIGQAANIIVSGTGLNNVTTVNFEPPEGITLTGSINSDITGEQLTIPVQIAEDAEQTLRELILLTNTTQIRFAPFYRGQLLITGTSPEISSMDPVQQFRGANITLLIRGHNLNNTVAISEEPSTGISFGAPDINTTGTELSINLVISPTAPLGPRVIIITTLAGSTENIAMPANTFTIIN